MKKIPTLFVFLLIFSISVYAQQMFNDFSGLNIGSQDQKGAFHFNEQEQSFTLSGAGYNIGGERDEFYMVSQKIEGDFIFSANLKFLGNDESSLRKIGLMIRNSANENSIHINGAVLGDGTFAFQHREKEGAKTLDSMVGISATEFIQLERKGSEFICRISKEKEPLIEVGRVKLRMGETVLAGMFICSQEMNVVESAQFWNVRIEKPAPEIGDGYQNPSPSRLEILDVETGFRKVIYETDTHIEAPNWSRDGKYLIYNSSGKLYKFDLKSSKISEINTGSVIANNNDHGISFSGKMLAISSSAEYNGKNRSVIYTVPVKGGKPKRITEKGPSYWHGWSPNDRYLTYCAERDGNYDVYKIPAEGGEEVRLTSAKGLDDGPEYSPDGEFIYFNSTRSGSMEIWRMKPDGEEQKQITIDRYQNWFAHPSPDGKNLIFISYLPHILAGSHPRNKRVMLRLMPVNGGDIKTLAFLYGGQGTINVPSWSPDSKKIAFVSYTY